MIYLATVYTQHPVSARAAWEDSCREAAEYVRRGVPIFCPIAHGYGMSEIGGLKHYDHDFWMQYDVRFVDMCTALLVVMAEGWTNSQGIEAEIKMFMDRNKHVMFTLPGDIAVEACREALSMKGMGLMDV